jgi:hypothetical protein
LENLKLGGAIMTSRKFRALAWLVLAVGGPAACLAIAQDTPGFTSRMPEPPEGQWGIWKAMKVTSAMGEPPTFAVTADSGFTDGGYVGVIAQPVKEFPASLFVQKHDFPGKNLKIRIDANPSMTLPADGRLTPAAVEELKSGKILLVEYYHWPYDAARLLSFKLEGFPEAWERISAWVLRK